MNIGNMHPTHPTNPTGGVGRTRRTPIPTPPPTPQGGGTRRRGCIYEHSDWISEYMNIQDMEYLEISKYEKMRA